MIRTMKKKAQEKKTSFVRLTRLDGNPIWLNVSFIVTVEPRRGGGTTVVPIGDGLDYDVRETPETVLAYLDGAPVPEVVPVPTPDALTPTPDDVSPVSSEKEPPAEKKEEPAKKPTRKTATRKRVAKAKSAETPEAPAFVPAPVFPGAGDLLIEEIARLRKMAPRTVKKLQNTIMTQFKSVNAEAALATLVTRGIIVIDGTRVNWQQPETPVKMKTVVSVEEPVGDETA